MKRKRIINTDKTDKTVTTTKKTEQKEEKMKNHEMVTISGSMSRTVNLGDFESAKIEFSVTQNVLADSDIKAGLDALFDLVEEKIDEKLKPYEDMADGDTSGDDEVDPPEEDSKIDPPKDKVPEEDESEEDSPEEEEEDITEEMILAMKRKDLIALIEKEGLDDLNHKDHKKIGDLRTAVINALFEEDSDEDSGDSDEDNESWDDDEWEDD